MRPNPVAPKKNPVTPDYADLATPVKKRIALAARRCFPMYGVNYPLRGIAELAQTNEATLLGYYQSHGKLVQEYVEGLITNNEVLWREAEAEHPDDPEAQLRGWIEKIELMTEDAMDSVSELARAEAQLFRWDPSPLLRRVRAIRVRELNRLQRLCEKAKFDEPRSLAHKLMLLVDGARSNSNCFEFDGPHSHLSEAASDLMAAHRGGGKLRSPLD
jgi:AcrR family transcriptional regulator